MKIYNKDQTVLENLSALLDGELSAVERDLLLDRLLGDPELMNLWQRHQLIHDAMHEQLHERLLSANLLSRVSQSLHDEPAHDIDSSIKQENVQSENALPALDGHSSLQSESWFSRMMSNKFLTGTSIAASVMFATLFTAQHLQNNDAATVTNLAQSKNFASDTLPAVQLPAHLVSSGQPAAEAFTTVTDKNRQFTWIKADPKLSQQIQDYVREHETHSPLASFNTSFTPRVRAVSYQPEQ